MKKHLLLFCLLLACGMLHAQDMSVLTSPVINPNGTITFRIKAPAAQRVEVRGQFMSGTAPLIKGTDGIWSVTIPFHPSAYHNACRTHPPANASHRERIDGNKHGYPGPDEENHNRAC